MLCHVIIAGLLFGDRAQRKAQRKAVEKLKLFLIGKCWAQPWEKTSSSPIMTFVRCQSVGSTSISGVAFSILVFTQGSPYDSDHPEMATTEIVIESRRI